MKIISAKFLILAGASVLVVLSASPALAIAQDSNGSVNSNQGSVTTTNQSDSAQAVSNRFKDAVLKKCQTKEANINKYMLRITDRAEKQLNLFTQITERVQKYYEDNKLSLSNYDELVAAVTTTRTQAQNSFQAMEQNGGEFKCDSADPKAYTNQFRNSFNQSVDALKAYKTAVRNLIVGVKSVAVTEEG